MRRFLVLVPVLAAACSTAPAAPPAPGAAVGHRCVAEGVEQFLGQAGNSATGAAILAATHAAVLRWAPPGYMLTMDYREDRVTVKLDSAYRITNIGCG